MKATYIVALVLVIKMANAMDEAEMKAKMEAWCKSPTTEKDTETFNCNRKAMEGVTVDGKPVADLTKECMGGEEPAKDTEEAKKRMCDPSRAEKQQAMKKCFTEKCMATDKAMADCKENFAKVQACMKQ
ncbi:hypothetical protein HDE_09503 [Halotydeus destructor]|nr:hypothetical protein HDE_09503 [Halotydeus destructor]